jgi:hypothetical protein
MTGGVKMGRMDGAGLPGISGFFRFSGIVSIAQAQLRREAQRAPRRTVALSSAPWRTAKRELNEQSQIRVSVA